MAVRVQASLERIGAGVSFGSSGEFQSMGSKFVRSVQTIGTVAEAINLGEVINVGWVCFRNDSQFAAAQPAHNILSLRMDQNGPDFIRLRPGEVTVFRPAASTLFAISSSSSTTLSYLITDD